MVVTVPPPPPSDRPAPIQPPSAVFRNSDNRPPVHSTPARLNPTSLLAAGDQIEASWKGLSASEQESTFKALEELQKKDWKELSIDEKKAGKSITSPLTAASTRLGVSWAWADVGLNVLVFSLLRRFRPPRPSRAHPPAWIDWQDDRRSRPRCRHRRNYLRRSSLPRSVHPPMSPSRVWADGRPLSFPLARLAPTQP